MNEIKNFNNSPNLDKAVAEKFRQNTLKAESERRDFSVALCGRKTPYRGLCPVGKTGLPIGSLGDGSPVLQSGRVRATESLCKQIENSLGGLDRFHPNYGSTAIIKNLNVLNKIGKVI